jgi:hypothetical protein
MLILLSFIILLSKDILGFEQFGVRINDRSRLSHLKNRVGRNKIVKLELMSNFGNLPICLEATSKTTVSIVSFVNNCR